MTRSGAVMAFAIFLWAITVAVGLAIRPPLPVDETRYLAVAWEMWQRGDFLVPYINGIPYHHKPPLLFWMMQAGWTIVGVSEAWGTAGGAALCTRRDPAGSTARPAPVA
jgi:4-amino-4-deoxy-L-arabinose transferase-like glycosyltransferase